MPNLKKGDNSDGVARLQALLCLAGFDAKPIDGAFGRGTEAAVCAYQEGRRLEVNGVVGDDTQASLGMDRPDPTKVPVPVIDRVTADMVAEMFHPLTPRRNIDTYLPAVLGALGRAALDDRDMVLMALATIRAESEGFAPIDEIGNDFGAYEGRADIGNTEGGDGARYKGRGFIQLTGRGNYRKYGERLGVPLETEPARANEPATAADLLAVFLKDRHARIKYALFGDDLRQARKLVNGGSYGLDRFTETFEKGAT